jgi:hypothetical protein
LIIDGGELIIIHYQLPILHYQLKKMTNFYFTTLIRIAFTFVALFVIQWKIPWYLLTIGILIAGFFMLKTSDDKPLSYGMLIGGTLFGIYTYWWNNFGILGVGM